MRECGQVEGGFWVAGARWETLFLHLSCPSCSQVPLLCSGWKTQSKLCLSGSFLLPVLFLSKRGTYKFERPEADLFGTVFYFYTTCVAPLSLSCVLWASNTSANHSLALQFGYLGTEVSGLGLRLSEIYKMELMKPFTDVRCEHKWICVYGLLDCYGDEYHIIILRSVQDSAASNVGIVWCHKVQKGPVKSCTGEFNSGISLKLFLTCL